MFYIDIPYTGWKGKKGGNYNSGECFYTWDNCYWASSVGIKSRVAARFGGYASNGSCSPLALSATHAASISSRAYCGLAQLLLDV